MLHCQSLQELLAELYEPAYIASALQPCCTVKHALYSPKPASDLAQTRRQGTCT